MFKHLALAAALLASPAAMAAPILSGDGAETCNGGACVVVAPHPAWQAPGAGQWISYADTGYGGDTLALPGSMWTVTEAFSTAYQSLLRLTVWADDTARVLLNGVPLNVPNMTQGTCAVGPLGCEPGEQETFALQVAAGAHSLTFEVFQTGTGLDTISNPSALMYEGEVNAIPLPASALLMLAALAGLATIRGLRTE